MLSKNTQSNIVDSNANLKKTLRQQFRHARRALSEEAQNTHARSVAKKISRLMEFKHAEHIAMYLPVDGELSLLPLIQLAQEQNKCCYLPRVEGDEMCFHQYRTGDDLDKNQYGILEPKKIRTPMPANALDIVCLPLVSFDAEGRRLGMGGGYYDRCFEFKTTSMKPALVGVAHGVQEAKTLPEEAWDIRLDLIVSEEHILNVSHS